MALVSVLWTIGSSGSLAADRPLDPSRIGWSSLAYRASKLTVTATSEVRLAEVPAASAKRQWLTPSRGRALTPSGSSVILMELDSQILGKSSALELWLDPVSGSAFQRIQLETGKKARHNRHRALRFTDTGVFNATRRADDETVRDPFTRWALTEVFEPYPVDLEGAAVVTEPTGLFYFLAVAELDTPGATESVRVFSKGHLLEVVLTVQERTRVDVDLLEVSEHSERRVREEREVVRIRMTDKPVADDPDSVSFEFLGLKGDIDIFLDPGLRAPVEIRGRLKFVGRGRVRLERVGLNPPRTVPPAAERQRRPLRDEKRSARGS